MAAKLPATAYAARFGPAELLIRVDGSRLDVTREDGPVDLAFAAEQGIRRLLSGELAPDRAIATGMVTCCTVAATFSTASRTPSTWSPDPARSGSLIADESRPFR